MNRYRIKLTLFDDQTGQAVGTEAAAETFGDVLRVADEVIREHMRRLIMYGMPIGRVDTSWENGKIRARYHCPVCGKITTDTYVDTPEQALHEFELNKGPCNRCKGVADEVTKRPGAKDHLKARLEEATAEIEEYESFFSDLGDLFEKHKRIVID